jgi:hypothetical protein
MFQTKVVQKVKAHRASRHLAGVSCSDDLVTTVFILYSNLLSLGCSDDVVTNIL